MMNDRTEEAKALREFMLDESGATEEWLHSTVSLLKKSNAMFGYLSADTQELLRLLTKHSAVEYAFGCEKIRWGEKNFPGTNAASTYRIKPGYELPDLTEVTPPRYANGTMLLIHNGTPLEQIVEVVDRENYTGYKASLPADWCGIKERDGTIRWGGENWYNAQELPPMPDKAKLEAQGYRFTMNAADCSLDDLKHRWVLSDTSTVASFECRSDKYAYNGWRWLVEKIEQELEEWVITFSGPDIAVHKCNEKLGISIPSNSTMSIENRSEKPLMFNAEPQGEQQ